MAGVVSISAGAGNLKNWLRENKPSRTRTSDGVYWIEVNRPTGGRNTRLPDVVGLKREWTELQKQTVSKQIIKGLASRHHVTCGKWLFYVPTGEQVDKIWSKVAKAVYNGTIPSFSAKVSTTSPGNHQHVICVYNENFLDRQEVMSCEEGLRHIGIKYHMHYKSDAYSYLGIYSQNRWGLPASLYSSYYNTAQGTSQIRNN